MLKTTITFGCILALSTAFAGIAGKPAATPAKETSVYDALWKLPTLYQNKESLFLNEFRIIGRAHFDEYGVSSNLGWDQDWIVRRLRIGAKAVFFHNFTGLVELDLNPQNPGGVLFVPAPVYQKLTDASLAYKFCDSLTLTIGKQSAKFTLDGSTSSNDLLTIDRNNLSNNLWFTSEYFSGARFSGNIGAWQYNTGLFSGGSYYQPQSQFENSSKEFGNFNGKYFWLGSVGYDFGKRLGLRKALLRGDFVYNPPDPQDNATKNFGEIGSLNFQLDAGKWGFSTDVAYGSGSFTQSDVFGAVAMPWFNLTKQLQLVSRYTYLSSAQPDGLSFNRYENVIAVNYNSDGSVKTNPFGKVSTQKGDQYNEVYLGVNYYLYGHKLKLQTGWDYAWMNDVAGNGGNYNGWGLTTALRINW